MLFDSVQVLLTLALLAIGVNAQSGETDLPSILNCVATAGNQDLCDRLLDCGDKNFPPRYKAADDECKEEIVPEGPGNCNTGELFGNKDTRDEIGNCTAQRAPKDLTDNEQAALGRFADCITKLGDECFGKNN
ncbi:hypothetical protein NPIL_585981 [Nephila pilipes]|uniref:Secreted protein n=1 Tax=Nephila pilipes TaxID=299642 RepID=A0A8X6R1N0_NEPPI|nr:hypothetical protein NPIL_585981 [Nephila pilipes]